MRQRRAARWYAALAMIAVGAAGVPVSLIVTPLLFLIGRLAIALLAALGMASAAAASAAQEIDQTARIALTTVRGFQWPTVDYRVALMLFLPGAAAMVALWFAVWRLMSRAGAGGVLLSIGARGRTPGEFEEHQLDNVVGEMAIAAGTQPPDVRLLDVGAANAAATGIAPGDATLIVTRGLLDRLNRDETQGVIGHLVASIGNGDLSVATLLLSVQQTLGLLTLILNAPFGAESRHLLARLLRSGRTTEEAGVVADLLAGTPLEPEDDVARRLRTVGGNGGPLRLAFTVVTFPFMFVALSARMAAILIVGGLFGPLFAAMWRRRRRVADAMAVQLTRNPEGLARALGKLAAVEHHVPRGAGAAHLFVVWQPDQRGQHLSRVFGGVGALAPSIARRTEALRRMGANSVAVPRRVRGWRDLLGEPSRTIILTLPPLVLLGGYVAVLTLGAFIAFNFLFLSALLVGVSWAIDFVSVLLSTVLR